MQKRERRKKKHKDFVIEYNDIRLRKKSLIATSLLLFKYNRIYIYIYNKLNINIIFNKYENSTSSI